jgi:hypothetical protein
MKKKANTVRLASLQSVDKKFKNKELSSFDSALKNLGVVNQPIKNSVKTEVEI